MADPQAASRRRRALAELGGLAVRLDDLDHLLAEAGRLVGEGLGTGSARVLEILGRERVLLAHGAGAGRIGPPMGERPPEAFALAAGGPVVSEDLAQERRFAVPPPPLRQGPPGVAALANVPILLPGGRSFGLIQVSEACPRRFSEEEVGFLRCCASILGPAVAHLLAAERLGAAEERFRLTVEAALNHAILITDAEDRITDWPPGAQAVFGWTAEEVVGRPAAILYAPEDRSAGVPQAVIATARAAGVAPDVRWLVRKDGSRVFVEGSVRALRHTGEGGQVRGFLRIGQDATERRRAEERRRESEARLAAIFAQASVGLSEIGLDGRFLRVNDELCRILGRPREEVLRLGIADVTHGEDVPPSLEAVRRALAEGQPATLDKRYRRPNGTLVWANSTVAQLHDAEGRPGNLLVATVDLTDRKAAEDARRSAEERLRVVVAELQHRTRNLLGLVRSVARRTRRDSRTLEEFFGRFDARLGTLALVNGLLSRLEDGDRVAFDELLRAELYSHGAVDRDGRGPQVRLDGPPGVRLRSATVQILALALHELATNAAKHGALARPEGRLSVRWRLERDPAGEGGKRRLRVEWEESGVPLPPAAEGEPDRMGSGRELIEQALPYQLGAETEFRLRPDGVRCVVVLPLSAQGEDGAVARGP